MFFSHKCDSTYLIYVIIHVEKTVKAFLCQRCGKYVKKKQRITEHLKKMHKQFFWFSVKDINISDIFYKMQNVLGTVWASIITTYLIKLLGAGLLKQKQNTKI